MSDKGGLSRGLQVDPDLGRQTATRQAAGAVRPGAGYKEVREAEGELPPLPPRSLLPPHRPLPTRARAFARGAEPRLHRLLLCRRIWATTGRSILSATSAVMRSSAARTALRTPALGSCTGCSTIGEKAADPKAREDGGAMLQ